MPDTPLCFCDSGKLFTLCCHPYMKGKASSLTAEALMRSRYSAYVLEDAVYLLATWHPDTRPAQLQFNEEPRTKWLGLTIKRSVNLDDNHAEVEFVARYKIQGRAFRMHETSQFERIDGRWFYRDGLLHTT